MASAPVKKSADKSYLSSAVESLNPWATASSSKRTSPSPPQNERDKLVTSPSNPLTATDSEDHSTTHLYGRSTGRYPPDCPPLKTQWFHAVDVIKRKPQLSKPDQEVASVAKPLAQPKKYSPFSASDSSAIESQYQKLLEAAEVAEAEHYVTSVSKSHKRGASIASAATPDHHVPVNEDFLFDVNIEKRELTPAYWLGPVYEVRRGTWFYQEGSILRPCEENLAAQLEEGYLKIKPWLNPVRSRSQSTTRRITPKASQESVQAVVATESTSAALPLATSVENHQQVPTHPQSHRLFGMYMNNVATYQDATTAWLSSDGMLSWVTSSVYERFAGGGFMSGVKLVRGYKEGSKTKEKGKEELITNETSETNPGLTLDEDQQKILKRKPGSIDEDTTKTTGSSRKPGSGQVDEPKARLQRQLTSMMGADFDTGVDAAEQLRKKQEEEIIDDYNAQVGEKQGREIEHLVLVTHGIGQQLGLRTESVNFVHDVNVLRKTLKSVYASSADLKALNSELGLGPGNCRVQVLPVCWRHLLDFPRKRERRREHDLGDANEEEEAYPSLQDITVEGVAFARSLISDLALDVLLYQSSYREQICRIVVQECNRTYALFKERNPDFQGKVHLIGHSLGSAILFDILCREPERHDVTESNNPLHIWTSQSRSRNRSTKYGGTGLSFAVEDFYCLGSPIGLFQMLKGRTIAGRHSPNGQPSESPSNTGAFEGPFLSTSASSHKENLSPVSGLPFSVSSPKVEQLFNIFHPSDPIGYRLEPLVAPVMTRLKPQGLPYTKKGILDAANQGITGIGAKVGQSVSGLWSSFSAGIASGIINRSLGLTSEEVAQITENHRSSEGQASVADKEALSNAAKKGEEADERKKELAISSKTGLQACVDGKEPTLIDGELETLFSQFQKQQGDQSDESGKPPHALEEQRRAWKMRAEEAKMKALNRNGRIDYSIQESVLDFNPINTIASHLGYWSDADVNHFILSQLLSKKSQHETHDREMKAGCAK